MTDTTTPPTPDPAPSINTVPDNRVASLTAQPTPDGLEPVPPLDPEVAREQVLDALREVWDPELGLDIVSLGLVYEVRVDDDSVEVDMTLTTPGCPVSESLPQEAATAVQWALPGFNIDVNLVWDPPWTPDLLSPEASASLGFSR